MTGRHLSTSIKRARQNAEVKTWPRQFWFWRSLAPFSIKPSLFLYHNHSTAHKPQGTFIIQAPAFCFRAQMAPGAPKHSSSLPLESLTPWTWLFCERRMYSLVAEACFVQHAGPRELHLSICLAAYMLQLHTTHWPFSRTSDDWHYLQADSKWNDVLIQAWNRFYEWHVCPRKQHRASSGNKTIPFTGRTTVHRAIS